MKTQLTFLISTTLSALVLASCGTVQTLPSNSMEFDRYSSRGVTYFLPKKQIKLSFNYGKNCIDAVTFSLMPAIADTSQKFTAMPLHNIFRDDRQSLTVNNKGLLTTGNFVSIGKLPEILNEAAGASQIHKERLLPGKGGAKTCDGRPVEFIFDPANDREIQQVLNFLGPQYRMVTDWHRQDNRLNPYMVQNDPYLNQALYYRMPANMMISLERNYNGKWFPEATANASLPQIGPIGYIPMRAGGTTQITSNVAFTDGMLTSWTYNRPSEALAVAKTPLNMAKAALTVPKDLMTLRYERVQQEALLVTEQGKVVSGQGALLSKEQKVAMLEACIETANSDPDKTNACIAAYSAN